MISILFLRWSVFWSVFWQSPAFAKTPWDAALAEQATNSEQAIVVTPAGGIRAVVHQLEKQNEAWLERAAYPAVVGLKGFAAAGAKVEGDKKTPSGHYGIITAWGYGPNPGTELPYKTVDDEDKVIDDVESADYNRWIHGPTEAKSFEKIKRKDGLYEFGLFIDYNALPPVKGKGSAVFLHVWRSPEKGTLGCVAVAKETMTTLLKWLKPKAAPQLLLNPK